MGRHGTCRTSRPPPPVPMLQWSCARRATAQPQAAAAVPRHRGGSPCSVPTGGRSKSDVAWPSPDVGGHIPTPPERTRSAAPPLAPPPGSGRRFWRRRAPSADSRGARRGDRRSGTLLPVLECTATLAGACRHRWADRERTAVGHRGLVPPIGIVRVRGSEEGWTRGSCGTRIPGTRT